MHGGQFKIILRFEYESSHLLPARRRDNFALFDCHFPLSPLTLASVAVRCWLVPSLRVCVESTEVMAEVAVSTHNRGVPFSRDLSRDCDVVDGDLAEAAVIKAANEPGVINVNEDIAEATVDNAFAKNVSQQDVVLALADSSDADTTELIDQEHDMTWVSLVWLYIVAVSSGALHFAEYLGEKLADLFGITSPRYGYVMEEWDRIQRQRKQEEQEHAEEQLKFQQALAEKSSAIEDGTASEQLGAGSQLTVEVSEATGDVGRVSPSSPLLSGSATPLQLVLNERPDQPSGSPHSDRSPHLANASNGGVSRSSSTGIPEASSPMLEDVEL
ncbi:uncharacterized protein LOC135822351 [Sycon ciliatum]|uniref:uncharacterized protein LOC135822351 n=1 Tax=Sycon ciliatum TaxID=27933 RepID=UPI0031F5FEF5